MNLSQLVKEQNQKLIDNNSIYRLSMVNDQVEVLDIDGGQTHCEEEDRFLVINQESDLVDYIDDLISNEQSCQ